MKNKTQINIHAHHYISAVFADTLRQEGFHCPDDKLLCWYRVRNQEVLDTVIFCSSWSNLPLTMNIYYETVPLFTRPVYIRNVHYNSHFLDRWDCYRRRLILEGDDVNKANLCIFSEDILVDAPRHGNRGLYTLTHVVLPYMQKIDTVHDCFMSHKESHTSTDPANRYQYMSREFMDEALYVNDLEVLPRCKDPIDRMLRILADKVYLYPKNAEWKKQQLYWQQLDMAISNEHGIEDYLDILQQREQENVAWLEKKLGIKI